MHPELQDRMAEELLRKRGYNNFVDGRMSLNDFQQALSKEWASLPQNEGNRSRYGSRAVQEAVWTDKLRPVLETTRRSGRVLDQYLDGGYLPPR